MFTGGISHLYGRSHPERLCEKDSPESGHQPTVVQVQPERHEGKAPISGLGSGQSHHKVSHFCVKYSYYHSAWTLLHRFLEIYFPIQPHILFFQLKNPDIILFHVWCRGLLEDTSKDPCVRDWGWAGRGAEICSQKKKRIQIQSKVHVKLFWIQVCLASLSSFIVEYLVY